MKRTRTFKNYRRLVRYYEHLKSKSPLYAYLWANNHMEDILRCVWENNIPYTTNSNIEQWDLQVLLLDTNFYINKEYYRSLLEEYEEDNNNDSYYSDEDWNNEDAVIRAMRRLYKHGIICTTDPLACADLDFTFIPFKRDNIKKYRIFKRNMRILKEKSFEYKFKGNVLHINICNTYITIRA